jgi:uncharacterized protein YjgD (DUF1641 family)
VAEQGVGVLSKALTVPTEPLGPWGAFRALSDPDAQHGLGFVIALARAIGQRSGG